jgi:hypothetical protein
MKTHMKEGCLNCEMAICDECDSEHRVDEATLNPPAGISCRYCYDVDGGCQSCVKHAPVKPLELNPRQDFALSLVFGLRGVKAGPGCCEVLDAGTPAERFADPVVEGHYLVWLDGYNSKALRTRDRLREAVDQALRCSTAATSDRAPVLRNLLALLQDEGFLPKRPGD